MEQDFYKIAGLTVATLSLIIAIFGISKTKKHTVNQSSNKKNSPNIITRSKVNIKFSNGKDNENPED